MFLLESDFDKVILTKEEKDLIIQMDCENINIYKIESQQLINNLNKIKKGVKVFLCKENNYVKECELKEIYPLNLNIISYDNDYIFYSYILANNKEEAYKFFIEKLEFLKIYKNGKIIDGINIDDNISLKENLPCNIEKIKIKDKFPERTKRKKENSKKIFEEIKSFLK